MINYKIFSLNEWKESENYTISKYFKDKNIYLKRLFETNELYKDLIYERYEHDDTIMSIEVRFAYLFFSDKDFNYKLELILDFDKLNLFNEPEQEIIPDENTEGEEPTEEVIEEPVTDLVIDELDYKLYGTSIKDDTQYEPVLTTIKDDELTDDFIITLISEFKEKNKIE